MFDVNAIASSQNVFDRSVARGEGFEVRARAPRVAEPARGGSTNTCKGRQMSRFNMARTDTVVRHPRGAAKTCVSGQNKVLAKPAASVRAVTAFLLSSLKL